MDNIVIADKASSQLTAQNWGNVQLNQPSVVQIPARPEQLASTSRSGQDLILNLKSGEQIKITNFFVTSPDGVPNDIVFQGDDATLWQARYNAEPFNGFTFDEIGSLDELIAGVGVVDGATPAWAIAGLGLLGAGGAAAAAGGGGGGGGGGGNGDATPPAPATGLSLSADGRVLSGFGEAGSVVQIRDAAGNLLGSGTVSADGRFQVDLNTPQTNGQPLDVTLTDGAGNVSTPGTVTAPDTTAPTAPANLSVSANGTQLSGSGEAGATIQVRAADGRLLGSAVVAADGTFSVTLSPAQTGGQPLTVNAIDAAGNISTGATVSAPEIVEPQTPANLGLSSDGSQLSGTARAGTTVEVRAANGDVIGRATVGADGTFTVTLSPAQANGEVISVVALNSVGAQSPAVTFNAPDITGPAAATDVSVGSDGLTVTGRGEPGSTVSVTNAQGTVLGTALVAADGSFTVQLNAAQIDGEALSVQLTDAAANPSPAVTVIAVDLDGLTQPSDIDLSVDGAQMKGRGQVGSTVTVRDANGNVLGSAVVGADGTFTVQLSPPQNNGETLQISASDSAGNTSAPLTYVTPDTQGPAPLTGVTLDNQGQTLTGQGEAGAAVTVRDPAGNIIGTGTVGSDGNFSVNLSTPQTDAQQLQVIQTDADGNPSAPVNVTAPDLTVPVAVSDVDISANGAVVTGNGQPGATVTVTDAGGVVLGTVVVGSDGRFEINLSSPQTNGQNLNVVQTDASTSASPAVPVQAPDIQAPTAPADLALDPTGSTLTGTGEPGATVSVKDLAGNTLGTAIVDGNGAFTVSLNSPQTNGQPLQVSQSDGVNVSPSTPLTAADITAPLAPDNLVLNSNGVTLTGTGQAGSTVTVTTPDGTVLGTTLVASNGSFTVNLSPAQLDGQVLSVIQTDASTLPSPATPVTAPDVTAQPVPTGLIIDPAGATVSGTTQPNNTVRVLDADGNVIGTATADGTGAFTVNLDTAQTNGEALQVVVSDGTNASLPGAVTAPDDTPPAPVSDLALNPAGDQVSGLAEPGTLVTVSIAGGGTVLGTATAGADGRFVVTLSPPAEPGGDLEVISTDGGGNDSPAVPLAGLDGSQVATPNDLALSVDGFTLTGAGTPGCTVTVTNSNGDVLGSGLINEFGRFTLLLNAKQINAQVLQVTATSPDGDVSVPGTVTAADGTPPEAVSNLVLNATGSALTGLGEAGATVTVTDSNGTVVGTALVASNGSFSLTLTPAQLNGQALTVIQSDAAGNPSQPASLIATDLQPPAAATGVTINDVGTVVKGQGEAGSTVTVRDAVGNVLATGLVDQSGNFQVTLPNAQTTGETLQVTLADANGNTSTATGVLTIDGTPPAAVQNPLISADGTTLSGTGEVGATVNVTNASGTVLGSAVVGADGSFSVTLAPAPTNGEALAISQTDAAGNVSPSTNLNAPDISPPAALTQVVVNADGVTVTGHGEPGATVSVRSADGTVLGTAQVGSGGAFSVTLSTPQLNAEVLTVTQEDPPGNVSTAVEVIAVDLTPPAIPSGLTLNAAGVQLAGNAEAGSTVTVRDSQGNLLGTTTAAANGTFQLTLNSAQANGQSLNVTATDAAGNPSAPAIVNAADTTAPVAANDLAVSANGATLTGIGEVGASVEVRDASGALLGTATVGNNGNFSITLSPAAVAGSTLSVVQIDAAGNSGPATPVTAPGNLAESAPTNLALSADGLTLTGSATAGSTVSIRNASGVLLGSAVVAANGTFSVTVNAAQLNGEQLSAVATSTTGINSSPTDYTAADIAAPTPLSELSLAPNGVALTGRGEAGATVTVLGTGGAILGSAVVAANGTFSVTLNPAQTSGQTLSLSQADAAGNESNSVNLIAPDLLAPTPPAALAVSNDGSVLTGTGEAGTTVNVFTAAGTLVGTGTVSIDGSFAITLTTPQANGQALTVSLTDAAGNTSAATPFTSVDSTPPAAVAQLGISGDGATLTGRGEPGAQVRVIDSDGNVLGTALVSPTGTFTLTLTPALSNAEVISVVQADVAGNDSPAVSLTTPDFTPPDPLANVDINSSGALVTGTGEPGATVTVRDANGTLLGTSVVLADGSFSVTLNPPQINEQILNVQQADPPGNVSAPVPVTAPDLTPPATPVDLQINVAGDVLTGRGEVGAEVSVTLADGTVLGTGTVGSDGLFQITLQPAQTNGEAIFVELADAAGNTSPAGTLVAADSTPPAALTDVAIDASGSLITGSGAAGSQVVITNGVGTIVGTGTVAADGSFSVTLNQPLLNGEALSVIQRDAAGNPSPVAPVTAPDVTAPAAPTGLQLTADGLTLTGSGEAGATVRVLSATGTVLGSATVTANGSFSVTLNPAQVNGEQLSVNQTDLASNTSPTAPLQAGDTTVPLEVADLNVSQDGLTVTGTGEPGAIVTVRDGVVVLGTATVAADGNFSVTLSAAQLDGRTLSVVQADANNNLSEPALVDAPDSTAPLAPTVTSLTADGVSLTGTAEAGSTVTVLSATGTVLGTAVALGNGTYTVTLNPAQTNGQVLSVIATDEALNVSPALSFPVPDITDPDAVTGLTISGDLTQLAGRGEAGASVEVTDALGTVVGTATVAANGTFLVTLTPGITAGQVLTVIQTDAANNVSADAILNVPAVPAPDAPGNLVLSGDGVTLTGTAAIGTTINVFGADNSLIGTGVTGPDGTFNIVLTPAQTNGESLEVTANTPLGGASLPTEITADDTSAPAPLSDLAVNASGTLVTGRGEVGATVRITGAGGVLLGETVVAANGTFSAQLNAPQVNGQLLNATQTDVALNTSPGLNVTAPDITPPAAPSALLLSGGGLVLGGLGEAGALVTVRGAGGAVLGTATVAGNGTFSVTLSSAQLNGQQLSVSQSDAAGNVSPSTSLSVADTTAPAALSNVTLNGTGLAVSGTGEAGATVSVTNAAGTVLGTAVVNAGGTFTVQLSSAQLNGQQLNVQQADPTGNLSPVFNLTANDTQAPVAATGLALATNGLTVSGTGEAGATVNVYGPGGALLGTSTVSSGGTFSFNLNTAQLDGQLLTVRLVDPAGNLSPNASLTAPDVTAPGAPTGVSVNGSGTLLTGIGVPGSTISVRGAGGVVLGTATVAANGSFSVVLASAQINSQVLSVTQADPSGNVSAAASATAPDLTPPAAATALLVGADGLTVTGTGEAGATVTIKSASGTVLGTGTVNNLGVFSIALNSAQINGEKLTVNLSDVRGNVSIAANVTAPDIDVNAPVVASDNLAVGTVTLAPATASQTFNDSFTTLLSGFSKTFTFSVASGSRLDPTLTLTTSSLISLLDGVVYTLQVKDASGNWITLDVNGSSGLLDLIALTGQGVRVDIGSLLSGDYRLTVSSTGIGVLTTVNTQLQLDVSSLTQFNGVAGPAVTGNVITNVGVDGTADQTGPDNGAQLQIFKNGAWVSAGAGTTVQGLYGTLTIDANGNYSYKPNGSVSSVGKVDVFNYQLVHPNGLSDTANLYVRIDSPQATEVWNDANLGSPALVVDATADIASTDVTLVNREVTSNSALGTFNVLLGGGSGNYNTVVAADTVSDLTVVVNSSNLLALLGSMTVGLYKLNTATNQYVLVKSYGGNALLNLGGGNYGIKFDDQTAGTYQVRVAVGGLGLLTSVNTSLINVATYTNQFVVGSYTPVSGNLLTDTAGGGADVLGSVYTLLSVLVAGSYVAPGYNGVSLVGNYGTLLVQANGNYTYTLKAGLTDAVIGQEDTFTYQLTHPNGTIDTATLTIDLNKAGAFASTAFSALASDDLGLARATTGSELIQGTDGNDTLDGSHGGAITLQGGAGDDTLVIADQQFTSVDGGSGTDTLLWAGGDVAINLGDLQSKVHNVEILDLNHSSAVSLTLNLSDLLAITSSDNNTLLIKGDDKDSVHMTDGWVADGAQQADGIDYVQYTAQEDPSHHLWVQNGIQVV
ncbi:VCBS repeat-containing protein [Pseudomonas sp. Z003-0.4C(8344-21)]|uniref:BapA/Bap/LapF family large adhesin n=1 Tax=Pseudomonas sp. Z003-0.4C(8344-21) TaxID=1855380 RepID=UPI00087B25F7|nr:BapA/Bap/LapF family large adhesin [Pseudomonas sp. Z003-0.4C(8344-21)]SDT16075.1 VCBS repeat-containing protein [Pseudomonas sp. Z003-0.4C(8344-21)]